MMLKTGLKEDNKVEGEGHKFELLLVLYLSYERPTNMAQGKKLLYG